MAQRSGTYEKTEAIRIVLVDDQPIIRRALRRALVDEELEIVGEVGDGQEAINLVVETAPDVVVMDLQLSPEMSGIECTRRLATVAPLIPVLVLTGSAEEYDVVEAIVAGACGYLLKTAEPAQIIDAIKAAAAGESVISSEIAGNLLSRVRETAPEALGAGHEAAEQLRATLTDRELEVLRLLASGKSNNEISKEIYVSPMTVKNHIASILAKLQLENRLQAAVHAVRSGIV